MKTRACSMAVGLGGAGLLGLALAACGGERSARDAGVRGDGSLADVGTGPDDATTGDATTGDAGMHDTEAGMHDAAARESGAAEPDAGPLDCTGFAEAFEDLADAFETELRDANVPGATIAASCGALVVSRAFGVTEAGTTTRVTDDTPFQIASSTKMLTAALALALVDRGDVDLDAPLESILPFIDARGRFPRSMTLAQLLAHTSGYPTEIPDNAATSDDLAPYFRANADVPLVSPPGLVHNYSNPGFALAGLGLQVAGGAPYADLVEMHVFAPAGMTHASFDAAAVEASGHFAVGHLDRPSGRRQRPTDSYYGAGWYAPMGGAWMSARELVTFGRALFARDGALRGVGDRMRVAQTRAGGTDAYAWGLGLGLDRTTRPPTANHSGSVAGFLTDFVAVPEREITLAATVNADWFFPGLAQRLDALVALEPAWEPSWDFRTDDLDDYVGTYVDPLTNGLGTITITRSGDAIRGRFSTAGTSMVTLNPTPERDSFTFRHPVERIDTYVTFWRDPAGDDGPTDWFVSPFGVAPRR